MIDEHPGISATPRTSAMPSEPTSIPPVPFLLVAAGMLALLVWGRVFRRDAFQQAPERRIGLGLMDIAVGVALTIGGMSLYQLLAPILVGAASDDAPPLRQVTGNLLAQLCTQIPPVVYLLARAAATPRGLARLGAIPTRPARDGFIGLVACLCVVPVVLGIQMASSLVFTWLGNPPPPIAHELLPLVVDERSGLAVYLLLVATAVLLAPLLEEALFRGLVQSSLVEATGGRRWPAILITAAGFTLIHLSASEPQALPGLFALSLAFGWLYERTGSLWPGILLHAMFNGLNLALVAMLF